MGDTTGATKDPATVYPPEAPELTPGFSVVHLAQSLVVCVVRCEP